jgi:hypothetical protein
MTSRNGQDEENEVFLKELNAKSLLPPWPLLSYFVPKWFKTDDADQVDSRAVYESLAKRVAESHKTVIQLATTIPLIEQHFQYSMNSVFDHFMAKYNKLGNQLYANR